MAAMNSSEVIVQLYYRVLWHDMSHALLMITGAFVRSSWLRMSTCRSSVKCFKDLGQMVLTCNSLELGTCVRISSHGKI